MANMSYCRFENTYRDLEDCQTALSDAGSVDDLEKTASSFERRYIRALVNLCKQIADDFGDFDDE